MPTVQQVSFRDMYHQVCYLTMNKNMAGVFCGSSYQGSEKPTGALVYGYIDHTAGFSFQLIAWASTIDGEISSFSYEESKMLIFRRGSVSDCEVLINNKYDISQYQRKIDMINKVYADSEGVAATRTIKLIDGCRNDEFPDDVMVLLTKANISTEGCWVRCSGVQNNRIVGELLNEPDQDFGVHCGSLIPFGIIKHDNKILCIAEL